MNVEIKDCPVCNSKAELVVSSSGSVKVVCQNAQCEYHESEDNWQENALTVIEKWNAWADSYQSKKSEGGSKGSVPSKHTWERLAELADGKEAETPFVTEKASIGVLSATAEQEQCMKANTAISRIEFSATRIPNITRSILQQEKKQLKAGTTEDLHLYRITHRLAL